MPAFLRAASRPRVSNCRRRARRYADLGATRKDSGQGYSGGKDNVSGAVRHRRVCEESRRTGRERVRAISIVRRASCDGQGNCAVFGGEKEIGLWTLGKS